MTEPIPYNLYLSKLFSLNTIGFLEDSTIRDIIAKYPPSIFRRSSVLDGAYAHFKLLLENRKINKGIEIGTFNGVTAAVLSKYCEQVVTIDIVGEDSLHRVRERIDSLTSFWKDLGIHNITPFIVNTEKEKADILRQHTFEFAFIDGNHLLVESDFNEVKRCGLVLFHEYWKEQPSVTSLVNSLPKEEVKVIGLNFAVWNTLNG